MKSKITLLLLISSFFAQAQMKNSKKVPSNVANTYQGIPIIKAPSIAQKTIESNLESPLNNLKTLKAPTHPSIYRDLEILRDENGEIIMVRGTKDNNIAKNRSVEQKAADYLNSIQSDLGFRQISESFKVQSTDKDELGQEHIRMQQIYKGIPIYGAEIILHSQENEFSLMNGRFYPEFDITDTNPSITMASAKTIIEQDLGQKNVELVESDFVKEKYNATLVIYHKNHKKEEAYLAWHVTIRPNAMARYEYFINAKTGEIIHSFNHTCDFVGHRCANHHANEEVMDGSADAQAADLFGIKRDLKAYLYQGTYHLIDVTRPMFKAAQSKMPNDPIGAIRTLDASDTSPEKSNFKFDNVTSLDNKWTGKSAAISAHYNAGLAYNYYKTVFGRESINGKGGTIIGLVNVAEKNGASMENAYWDGEAMFYGNGGSAFFPLARGLDVAGHEMSHGVIQNTANLDYENESGAMNESFADIFGAMIDRDDWKIGEDVVKSAFFPSGALRDLSNPNNGGKNINDIYWQPKDVSEKYTGSDDNGGVHINSGIPNFAFYKYATAVTKEKAEKVFYRALEKYLVKSSKFIDLRAAVQQAATDLYGAGSNEVNQVATAFSAVGIGSGGSSSGTGYQKDIAVNPGADIVAFTDKAYSNVSLFLPGSTPKTIKITDTDINSRPSVMDNGAYMVFVAADKSIHGISFDWTKGTLNEEIISTANVWRNAVLSKDGNRLAAVKDQNENVIYVFDFTKSPVAVKSFTLTNPTYTNGVSTGEVQYSDAMDFDVTGEYIMYDAFNILKGTTSNVEYWDIGFLRAFNNSSKSFGDGKISKLFSDLEEGASVGNPTFSKNSPHIIAFDYIEGFDQNKTYILTANLQTGDVGEIYYNGKDRLGFPSFSRLDDKILFETTDALGDFAATISLNADKLSAKTTNPAEVVNEAYFPLWFSNGSRVLVGLNNTPNDVFNVFPNPFDESITIKFKETFVQNEVKIIDLTGKVLYNFTSDSQQLTVNLNFLQTGTYVLKAGTAVQKIVKF